MSGCFANTFLLAGEYFRRAFDFFRIFRLIYGNEIHVRTTHVRQLCISDNRLPLPSRWLASISPVEIRSLAICRMALGATRGERAGGSFDTKWNTVDSARRSSRSAILARQHPQRISHARSSLPAPWFSHRSSLHCRFRDPLPGSPRCCYCPCDLRRDRNHLRPRSPGDIR